MRTYKRMCGYNQRQPYGEDKKQSRHLNATSEVSSVVFAVCGGGLCMAEDESQMLKERLLAGPSAFFTILPIPKNRSNCVYKVPQKLFLFLDLVICNIR